MLAGILEGGGYEVVEVGGREELLASLVGREVGAGVMGAELEVVRRVHGDFPAVPVLVVAEAESSGQAIEVVQAGAFDFLPTPVEGEELLEILEEALVEEKGPAQTVEVGDEEEADGLEMVGKSRAMNKLYRDVAKLAATPVTVLIRGETGTGKELVANALWRYGHRAHEPLVVVNCAAIPENLLESELFGYEKGAFTGATGMRKGKFEQAHGATLFLDEIGDMPLPLQAKMLRVLQEKRIERVGGRGEIPVDVRLIAATHQPLERMVEEGKFREDLFYRLNAAAVVLPPLRDRMGDVEILAKHFLARFERELGLKQAQMTGEGFSFLARQAWPGNVRQLQNVLRRALLKRRELVIGRDDLEEILASERQPVEAGDAVSGLVRQALDEAEAAGQGNALRAVVGQVEEEVIREALERSGGNQSKAARWLGVTRLTLREKVKGFG
ncbi:MAG: sigma-54 dependent transcriptional regulator [Verrucomicrobiota bacterium]